MKIEGPLLRGGFLRRYRRFLLDVEAGGKTVTIHCPNSGTMEGCLREGAEVLCSFSTARGRRLPWTAEWVRLPSAWVGIHTLRANRVVEEALRQGRVPGLEGYTRVLPEAPVEGGASRVDFLLEGPGLPPCYVEVKNTTWPTPDGGVGFPDAVTERGLKHLGVLSRKVREGCRGVMVYLVNRSDGRFFRPAREKDPAYARGLLQAAAAGVEILAVRARIDPPVVRLGEPLPVVLR